jgi:hypothetical protein
MANLLSAAAPRVSVQKVNAIMKADKFAKVDGCYKPITTGYHVKAIR